MKKLIAFVILYSSFVILLCPGAKAQWEGAEVQRLTYNNLRNKVKGLYIQEDDKLLLFYRQKGFDSLSWTYRDTLFLMTKEKGGEWSQPEEIGNSSLVARLYRKCLTYDARTDITHMIYQRVMPLDYDTMYYTSSELPDWQLVTIDSLSNEYMADYSPVHIGFDTLGNIHLAWNVDFDSVGVGPMAYHWYRVMYANNSTGEWVKQQVSEPICLYFSKSSPPHLAVQKNGTPHIVYHGQPCYLECVSFYVRNDSLNSTNWITDTVPKPSRPLWFYWASHIKVDVSDRVHLLTGGCIDYDCPWPDMKRTFYYYKQAEDSIWQGEEQIPDTALGDRLPAGYRQLVIDQQGIPYVSYLSSDGRVYFTDRKQGGWRVPYLLVNWREDPDSVVSAEPFHFVLDSQGKGHGAFSGANMWHAANDDSLEIYYFFSSSSHVDTGEDYKVFHFNLFQNYPNPFNSVTSIQYTVAGSQTKTADSRQPTADGSPIHTTHGKAVDGSQFIVHSPIHTTLKIYNILGKEVRELVNTTQSTGRYTITWDGRNNEGKEVASGIYFYVLRAGESKEVKKMLLIK